MPPKGYYEWRHASENAELYELAAEICCNPGEAAVLWAEAIVWQHQADLLRNFPATL